MSSAGPTTKHADGYAMAAMLVAIAVMTVAMTVALPAWRQANQREKESELVFRGQQYVRAIQLFQRKYAAAYPPSIDVLVKQKFLRKKYTDPMTEDGQFEVLYQGSRLTLNTGQPGGGGSQAAGQRPTRQPGPIGTSLAFDSGTGAITQGPAGGVAGGAVGRVVGARGGVIGVRSKSSEASLRIYNGAAHYNEWLFVFLPTSVGRGQARPGMGGGPGQAFPGGMGGGRGGPFRGGRGGIGGGPEGPPRGGPGLER